MRGGHILVVEDEDDILELVTYNLRKDGFNVTTAATGPEALDAVRNSRPMLILLDLMLPGLDGLEVCRRLKSDQDTATIPIVMLTAKGEEADIVSGLELGADDYITKPFSPRVMVARARAVLRRLTTPPASSHGAIHAHGLVIDPRRREVRFRDRTIPLTYTEFGVLHTLAKRPGWVFTRYQIVDAVRGEDYVVTPRAVDVQVVGLRKKLGAAGKLIETVRGVGYRFRD